MRSPRQELVGALKHQADTSPPSVRAVLEGYDAAVDAIVGELERARTPEEEARAAHRIVAAIAIHDSVVGGTLGPLLEAVPGGEAAAKRLRQGCLDRAAFQRQWDALAHEVSPSDLYRLRRKEAEAIIGQLIERFGAHEHEETLEVESLLAPLPDAGYRTKSSPLDDMMWPWHSEGPALLALRMALWGESAPTRPHPVLLRHPSSRTLRSLFHLVDHFRDYWGDTWLERWLFPDRARPPYPQVGECGSPSRSRHDRP